MALEVLASTIRLKKGKKKKKKKNRGKKKEMKGYQISKEEIKLFLVADDPIYTNPKESTRKLQELINSAKSQGTGLTLKNQLCFYTQAMNNLKRNEENSSAYNSIWKNQIFRNKSNQGCKKTWTPNYKISLKENLEDLNKWKGI